MGRHETEFYARLAPSLAEFDLVWRFPVAKRTINLSFGASRDWSVRSPSQTPTRLSQLNPRGKPSGNACVFSILSSVYL